jgi:RNA polymerase sigma factor (sigma-70 family)
MAPGVTPRELLLANLPLLRDLVGFLARRYRLSPEQIEELEGFVRLRLIEDDYDILRRWRQHSTLKTYLTVVVQRLFRDYCNQLWGKWRASAAAVSIGPLAESLEELLYREGLTFDEACQALASRPQVNRAQLVALHAQLPPRPGRPRSQPLGDEETSAATSAPNPEEAILQQADETAVARSVASSLRGLRAQDRLLLRLHYAQDLSVAEIARLLDTPAKALYKRMSTVLKGIRRDLRGAGVEARDIARLLQNRPTLDFGLTPEGENGAARPSNQSDDQREPRRR